MDPYIQQVADDNRLMAQQVLGWRLDALRIYAGMAEIVPWPDVPERSLRRRTDAPPSVSGARVMFHAGGAYLVRDKEIK